MGFVYPNLPLLQSSSSVVYFGQKNKDVQSQVFTLQAYPGVQAVMTYFQPTNKYRCCKVRYVEFVHRNFTHVQLRNIVQHTPNMIPCFAVLQTSAQDSLGKLVLGENIRIDRCMLPVV